MEKLKNINIAFVDIDGTLSNSERKITKETSEAIKSAKEKGLIVVLSSGRNNGYVCNASKNANASNYIISCNGAEIFDYENNISIKANKISKEKINIIWKFCQDNNIPYSIHRSQIVNIDFLPLVSIGQKEINESLIKILNVIRSDYLCLQKKQ